MICSYKRFALGLFRLYSVQANYQILGSMEFLTMSLCPRIATELALLPSDSNIELRL
jgi:hypothetical protein